MNMPCKVKNFIVFGIVVSIFTSFILCFSRQQPVNFIVTASKQLEQLKENLQVVTKEKKFEVDDKYLSQLGFHKTYTNKQSSSPSHSTTTSNIRDHRNGTLDEIPVVIVSAVRSNQLSQVSNFLKSVQPFFPPVVLWDLEIESRGSEQDAESSLSLKNFCNSSRCWVEKFIYDYPAHVKDLELKAYRPLIIQTMLERGGGCVLWIDIDRRLLPLSKKSFYGFLNMALITGIVGWTTQQTSHPTSTLTHPKTFAYFQTEMENYYFHRMIDPSQLLVCNTPFVHTKIMKPWVECSLTKDCISPVGAQFTGCRFDKKPLYRYSSCHGFDGSALNVALGLAFPAHQPYISRSPIAFPLKTSINQTNV